MASEIVIAWPEGERRYQLPASYTYREMARIKTITGLRAGEIEQALLAGDSEVIVAIAVVAAERAGDSIDIGKIEDLEFGAITVAEEPDPTQAADAAAATEEPSSLTPETPEAGGTPV